MFHGVMSHVLCRPSVRRVISLFNFAKFVSSSTNTVKVNLTGCNLFCMGARELSTKYFPSAKVIFNGRKHPKNELVSRYK